MAREKQTKQYELTDILLALLTSKLRKEVNRLDVMGFDELSAPNVTKWTKAMIERLLKENKKAFLKIAKEATEEAADDVTALGMSGKPIAVGEKYVDGVLEDYNPVTGYLYYPEADRKRSRLVEAILTAVAVNSRSEFHKELRKFANLWHTQTKQYGETMVDKTRIETFKKNGIKYVMWQTQGDIKVCDECRERNGKIYPLSEYPGKAHYNCRCWLVPVLKKEGNNGES